MEILRCIEQFFPGIFLSMVLGLLATISRLAYDQQGCDSGWDGFALMFSRRYCVACFAVIVAAGITAYYKLDRPISTSIILLVGFFAIEMVEQIKMIIKKIPCLATKWIKK